MQSCQLGISGFVGELSSAVTTTVFNFLLLRLAGNVGVAAYGVVANFALVATAIFNGVAQGAQPLISQCYGKNEMTGAKKLLLLGCGTALALAAVLYGAVFGFTNTFVALFNSENSALMAEYAHSGMRIYFLGYFFAGCNIVAAGYLGAVNRPTEATITSVSRGVAAIVTCCIHADLLVLLSDIDGLYTANPHTHPDAKLIPVVEEITPEIEMLAGGAGSALGTGGMLTKVTAAKRATEAGVDMIITNGAHAEVLYDIVEGKPVGTRFVGRKA